MSYTETLPISGFDETSCYIVSFPTEKVTYHRTEGANSQLETKALAPAACRGRDAANNHVSSEADPSQSSVPCDLAGDPAKP